MRARSLIVLFLTVIIGEFLFIPFAQSVYAAVPEPFIYGERFIGMPAIITLRAQTALRAGDSPTFQVFVHSNYSTPLLSADLSSLGFSNVSVVPGIWAGYGATHYPAYYYNFGPLLIGADVTDGVKDIPIVATDTNGNMATATARIIVDNIKPTLSLTNIEFSTISPRQGDTMYISGSGSGTGSPLTIYEIRETLWNAQGNPIWPPLVGINYNRDLLTTTIATSADGSFTRVPFTLLDTPNQDLANATSFKITIRMYDEAGNTASTSLMVPIPRTPPDPCAAPNSCASNVLFLPGIESSRLYEDLPCANGVCETKLWEPGGDALASRLAHDASGASVERGVYVKKNDVIDNAYIPLKGNVYKSFIEQMNGLVATSTINAWEAIAYDWRLTPDDILASGAETSPGKISYLVATSSPYIIQQLKRLAATSKTKKVTIIAHSNGGLLTKRLIEKLGPDAAELIDKIVFVAVPQAGTPQAVGALLHGYDQGLPASFISYGLSDGAARTLAKNMPMTYNLLPSETYFTQIDAPVVTFTDQPILAPFRSRYGDLIHSSELLHTFIVDPWRAASSTTEGLNYPSVGNEPLLTSAETLHTTDLDIWTPPTGIPLYEIAGWGEKTLAGIDYYQGVAVHCDQFSTTLSRCTKSPKIEYRPRTVLDGDGTVVTPSALWTPGAKRYWVDLKSYNKGFTLDRDHAGILEVPQLRIFLENIITNNDSANLPQYISTSTPANPNFDTQLHFMLHSPLTLNLYDDQGRHTGISTTTGELEENIPDSSYMKFGEVQFISVPTSLHTTLVMNGYAEGSFTLDAEEVSGETVVASTTFAGIPSTASAVATMDIPSGGLANADALIVDENGDGKTDITLVPKLGDTITLDITPPELHITFATSTKSLSFIGTDDGEGAVTITSATTYLVFKKNKKNKEEKELRDIATTTITARDEAGNTTALVYTEQFPSPEKRDIIMLRSLLYNGATTTLPLTVLSYKWNTNKKGQYSTFATYLKTASSTIESHYRPKKNTTVIMTKPAELDDHEEDDDSDKRSVRQTLPGMVVPGLQTEKGSIKIIY